jgi:hypothetical protein
MSKKSWKIWETRINCELLGKLNNVVAAVGDLAIYRWLGVFCVTYLSHTDSDEIGNWLSIEPKASLQLENIP